jgi:hypothetical protein
MGTVLCVVTRNMEVQPLKTHPISEVLQSAAISVCIIEAPPPLFGLSICAALWTRAHAYKIELISMT